MPAHRRLEGVALAAIPVAGVLVVDPTGWSPFGPAKWTAVVACSVVAVVAAGATASRLTITRTAAVAWLCFLAWTGLAAVRALDPTLAWTGTPQRHFGALTWAGCAAVYLAAHSLRPDRSGRCLAWAAAVAGGLAGLWAVVEAAGWSPVSVTGTDRIVGPLGSAAYLGAAEALLLPAAVALAADRVWRPALRLVAATLAGLALAGLVASGARAGWVGAAVAVAAVAWARRHDLRRAVAGRVATAVLAGALAVGALAGLAFATGSAGRVGQLVASNQPGGLSRVAEWEVGARVVLAHPLTGVGPEGYRIAFGRAVDAGYQRRYGRDPLPDRSHDALLDVAVTTGIPGAAAYLALLFVVGRRVRRAMRQRTRPWLAGLATGLAAYWVAALFLFPVAELEPAAWALAGVVCAATARPAEVAGVRTRPLARAALAGLGGITVALVIFAGSRAVAAGHDLAAALNARTYRAAAAGALTAARDDPGNIVVRLVAGETLASNASLPGIAAGLDQIDSGLRTSPLDPVLGPEKATLLVRRAEITGRAPDWSAAAGYLEALSRRDPRNPSVLEQLGLADGSVGRFGPARAALSAAAGLDPSDPAPGADLELLARMQSATGGRGFGTG